MYHPRFLILDAKRVDALLAAEGDSKDNNGMCNLMHLFRSEKLDNFDFGCRRFQELLQRQRDLVSNRNWTVLMWLCIYNPQLLRHDWAVELVHRLSGKVSNSEYAALTMLFQGNPEKTDFSSKGFKLLWKKEKDINVNGLKKMMNYFPELKEKVIAAVPDAIDYYTN